MTGPLATVQTFRSPDFRCDDASGDFPTLTGTQQRYAADAVIYREDSPVTTFYKVESGVIRTCRYLADGRRQIEAFYSAGEVFGLDIGGQHWLQAEAVSPCTVVVYRWKGLDRLDLVEADLARSLLSHAMRCMEVAQHHALLLGRRGAAEKLAAFLLDRAARSPDSVTVDLAMSRQDIADYLGLTIETVSRTMSQFERHGLIHLANPRKVLIRRAEELWGVCA